MSQDTIENKFVGMIELFRTEFEKLSQREKEKEQMINSLKKPCQLNLISSPKKDQYLLIKTHFPELKDKTIRILELRSESFVEQLENFLEEPIWTNKRVDFESSESSKIIYLPPPLRGSIINFGKSITDPFRQQLSHNVPSIGMMHLVNSEVAIWNLYGDLNKIDLLKKAKDFVQEYKNQLIQEEKSKEKESKQTQLEKKEEKETEQIKQTVPDTSSGYGTFFLSIVSGRSD